MKRGRGARVITGVFMFSLAAGANLGIMASTATASTSAAWLTPAAGSIYWAGTAINLNGQAAGVGTVGGTGLDLALVLDSSGSMTSSYGGIRLQQWQKNFANALVDSIPKDSSSIAVIEFDYDANIVRELLPLTPASNASLIHTAINNTDASGGTDIRDGIDMAKKHLLAAGDSKRSQMMVVFSDGESDEPAAEQAADNARNSGIEAIHSVGLPEHRIATMQAIVNGNDDIFGTTDDHGKYTGATNLTDLMGLVDIFNGTKGNLVALDHVDITDPNGLLYADYAVDGLGYLAFPWTMKAGGNTFRLDAYGDDGSMATAFLTLHGQPVPIPGAVWLLGSGLAGLVGLRRGRRKK